MKNKGFTLIELLAVIVILAIIALIAVPIILNIVNDSKEESNKRSVEMYAKALENAVATYQLDNNEGIAGKYNSDTLPFTVEYEGEVVCEAIEIYEDGKFYLDKCKVNKSEKEYTYGQKETQEYKIGDEITFSGSNWYVIADSSKEQDYVTLMKEKVLTRAELGDYAISYTCKAEDVEYEDFGCTTEGKIVQFNTMPYYWSDTCHISGYTYGTDAYDTEDMSGCSGHNDYAGSKVKEFLEGTYINTLGSDNLKEIDGYKIRLITAEQLENNFGLPDRDGWEQYGNDNVLTWLYQNYGHTDESDGEYGYWTMTPYLNDSGVWYVDDSGYVSYVSVDDVESHYRVVRPVINLKKSAI